MQKCNAVVALEPRTLFASISGTVFHDTDGSRVLTPDESVLEGQVVYIDANQNGKLDKGETFTRTAANGTYRFDNLPTGTYNIAQVLPANHVQTSPSLTGSVEGRFDIQIRYRTKMTPAQQAAFQIAADRWEAIIVGDLPNVRTDLGNTDDLIIDARVNEIDGVGGTLGAAGPRDFRDTTFLPSRGVMEFDAADLRAMESNGTLNDVITHEMGHVLGIGTIWKLQQRIRKPNSTLVELVGPRTVAEYNRYFGTNLHYTPIESDGGPGTAQSHWDEETVGTELMTGYVEEAGTIMPISRITVANLQDMGYEVNYDAADTYDPGDPANNKLWKPADAGVLPYQKRITLDRSDSQNNIDFGIRANQRPVASEFAVTPTTAAKGAIVTLSTRAFDLDGDKLAGVTFYRESNGIPGLQPRGDTYIASKLTSKRGIFSVTTSTADINAATATFYAAAVDIFQTAGRATASLTLSGQVTPPAKPRGLTSTINNSTLTLSWTPGSSDVRGYRIEIALRPDFIPASLVKSYNIAGDLTSTEIDLIRRDYYIRIRAFNDAGVSNYTGLGGPVRA